MNKREKYQQTKKEKKKHQGLKIKKQLRNQNNNAFFGGEKKLKIVKSY